MSAGEALRQAALAALRAVEGMGAYDLAPVQAAYPYAEVDAGPEIDWSHKSGIGRELRLAVTIRDEGERPTRLRRLMAETEAALSDLAEVTGWRLVTMRFLRSRAVREREGASPGRSGPAWAGLVEFRARMLKDQVPEPV